MTKENYKEIINQLQKKKILVFGDFMIDKYIYSSVERISPEAPVPIAKIINEKSVLGGAGNVINNILSLGSKTISLGVIGNDNEGKFLFQLVDELKDNTNELLKNNQFQTIVKTRVVSDFHQLLRIDKETIVDVTPDIENTFLEKLSLILENIDIVIIADYGKYVFSENFFKSFIDICNKKQIKILVDPVPKNNFKFKNVYLIKPNRKEVEMITHTIIKENFSNLKDVCMTIKDILSVYCVVITLGKSGMAILDENNVFSRIESSAINIFDVSGAGDTVIAVLGILISNNVPISIAAEMASVCASIVVSKQGTSVCNKDELIKFYDNKK